MKIKQGDMVLVTVGNDASDTPHKVLHVVNNGQKVVLEGVNLVYKHVRRGHPKSPQGGRLRVEMPIQSSNVRYYCYNCHVGTRLGLRYTKDGAKERFCRKCDTSAGIVSPPKKRYTQA